MSKIFSVMARGQEKEGGGYYWDPTGMKVIITEKQGEKRMYVKDARLGDAGFYSCFEDKPRERKPAQEYKPTFDDDIPF